LIGAGFIFRLTSLPEWTPTPEQLMALAKVLWRQYMPLLSSVNVKSGLQSTPLIIKFIINCFYKKNHHFYMKETLFPSSHAAMDFCL
jgi:hypothetical protein